MSSDQAIQASAHKACEDLKSGEAKHDMTAVSRDIDLAKQNMSPKDYNKFLQDLNKEAVNMLPGLEITGADSTNHTVKLADKTGADKDLAQEGIKREHGLDDKGHETSKTEFPNGVKVETTAGGETRTLANGNKITLGPTMGVDLQDVPNQPLKEQPKGSGMIVDKTGKQICKNNDDGSTTVFTDNGVYTANQDGSITKESAIKIKGQWKVFDTKNPLGDEMRNDMDQVAPERK